ncbi:D-alanyl-D-alanine carboxypeptidase family protein [Gaiella sp.]|uniref:D-alanyl-D-alanine carboxypeptidase family protein n=1 Tax=Gaiella sp. TaxID=2663207 RepID=UPI0032677CC8
MRRAFTVVVAGLALYAASAAGAPPPVSAPAYVVRGGSDEVIIAARAPDVRRAPASITKLMTVLVALEQARLDDVVTISPSAATVGESSAGLRPGEQLTVRDLAIAALVPSANDAAAALALHVGNGSLSRFVELMNEKARTLGLFSTHFANPHGLDQPGHVSSARDVTTLLTAALQNSFIRTWSSRSTATIAGGRTLTSTDGLIGKVPLVGAKTGHTNDAGWSQVAAVERNGVRITASLLGAASEQQRNAELASLLTWGLDQYRRVVVTGGHVYGHAEVGYGRPRVPLVAARSVVRSVRVGRPLVERVVASTALALPVTKGQRAGEVRVFSDGRLIARSPLVAAASVPEVGIVGQAQWYARRTVHHVFGLVS